MKIVGLLLTLVTVAFSQAQQDWSPIEFATDSTWLTVEISEKYGQTKRYKTRAIFESKRYIKLVSPIETHLFPIENISHLEVINGSYSR